jgi:signal transduction histidine kinase
MLVKNILFNLISNAIKFSPEKSRIVVISQTDAEGMELRIKDNGIGISAEDKAHLFERFFRAKNAANIQGTGLGLHIVAKYLELLGGRIELHSELNIGTEFIIYIPQSPNEKDPAD